MTILPSSSFISSHINETKTQAKTMKNKREKETYQRGNSSLFLHLPIERDETRGEEGREELLISLMQPKTQKRKRSNKERKERAIVREFERIE